MSLHALEPEESHGHGEVGAGQTVSMQFENIDQQNECYIVGMWAFLVTEVMFFGALFVTYSLFRVLYFDMYLEAHQFFLQNGFPWLGTINTFVLLFSSWLMVMAVFAGQHGQRAKVILNLVLVCACAFGFMGVKYVEYTNKLGEGLFPDKNFNYARALYINHKHNEEHAGGAHHGREDHRDSRAWDALQNAVTKEGAKLGEEGFEPAFITGAPKEGYNQLTTVVEPNTVTSSVLAPYSSQYLTEANHAKLFFSVYFSMTGLHGIHVMIGIFVMGLLILFYYIKHPCVNDYMPLEMVGLYWHFVDIVWIFLFPLMYLIS
jgi:cytochrome c oxidase subunit III